MKDRLAARMAAVAALIVATIAAAFIAFGDGPADVGIDDRAAHSPAPRLAPVPPPRVRPASAAADVGYDSVRAARIATGDSTFAALIANLSEPGGYFDSDNLISNEASYLHPIGKLERLGVTGGAYIGVGPDQNYSYIAAIRPAVAFLIDIRRDNLLEHLLFKALFRHAGSRLEYLCLLFGRRPPADIALDDAPIRDIVDAIDAADPEPAYFDSVNAVVLREVARFGLPLDDQDLATIRRFHSAFHTAGPGLKFSSAGRAPRPYYPTYRDLVLETDLEGRHASFLASRDRFELVKRMHDENRIVPVVGDLSGAHALHAIGDEARRRGLVVSAFYVSNVEYYLMRDRSFDRYAENVASLPRDTTSVIIRSLFGRDYLDPAAVRGYYSSQLLQTIESLAADHAAGGYTGYSDLITRRALDLRR